MPKNAKFSYSGGTREVYVTKFSYNWRLDTRGSSQARQRQTVYAWRAVQSELTVELQFASVDEYRDFAEFARAYHLAVTNVAGQVGVNVPAMYFTSDVIPHQTLEHSGMEYAGGIRYAVALPGIPLAYSNDNVAPKMRLTLQILMDESGDLALNGITSSTVSGSMREMTTYRTVTSNAVKSLGDAAYSAASKTASSIQDAFSR